MAKATILFADNDPDFLKTRAEFLKQEGYQVIPAVDPTEARRLLERGGIDLAILDIRLWDDDDEKDTSGLTLAKEVARSVPKIILTGFPSVDGVREALRPQPSGLPPVVDFVSKQEGPETMLQAMRKALAPSSGSTRVFVIHGHDETAREAVARLVEKLGLEAIILREQSAGGRTIIENFEKYANVKFAIALFTPDDIGGSRKQLWWLIPWKLRPRARQNVIFELGFFIGKLGRDKVCLLYKEGVEIPSDYQGVLYVPMDSAGCWKQKLKEEIKMAGIDVDPDKEAREAGL